MLFPISVMASATIHDAIQINHPKDLNTFKKTAESDYDPTGTVNLQLGEEHFVKIFSEDLTNKTEKEIQKNFQRKVLQFSLLFEERSSPYQGAITANTECFEKGNAKKQLKNLYAEFNTLATKNFSYGKCDGLNSKYFSKYFILVCRKKLYEIKFFALAQKNLEGISVKCSK